MQICGWLHAAQGGPGSAVWLFEAFQLVTITASAQTAALWSALPGRSLALG